MVLRGMWGCGKLELICGKPHSELLTLKCHHFRASTLYLLNFETTYTAANIYSQFAVNGCVAFPTVI